MTMKTHHQQIDPSAFALITLLTVIALILALVLFIQYLQPEIGFLGNKERAPFSGTMAQADGPGKILPRPAGL